MIESEQDKCTIQEAAKVLNIGRRTIYRWIDKGLLTRYKEGSKTYVFIDDVRALCANDTAQNDTDNEPQYSHSTGSTEIRHNPSTSFVVDKTHYEGLLIKLGQFEAERRYLLEYKETIESKDKALFEVNTLLDQKNKDLEQKESELTEAQAEIERQRARAEALETENNRLKLPWWKRLWKK